MRESDGGLTPPEPPASPGRSAEGSGLTPPGPPASPGRSAEGPLWVASLGEVPYDEAVATQERIRSARQAGEVPDVLLLLEHPPVYTKGRRAQSSDLPMGEQWYRLQGIDVRESDRGGGVTYHGPGQLVGYPVMRVRDVPLYVHTIEAAIITALADEGIEAEVREGLTGVWAGESKIGSIGVHVSRGVTTHGFAVNVDCDLQPFGWIVPCGIEGVRMTSVCKETGRPGSLPRFRERVASRFAEVFMRTQVPVAPARLPQPSQRPVVHA